MILIFVSRSTPPTLIMTFTQSPRPPPAGFLCVMAMGLVKVKAMERDTDLAYSVTGTLSISGSLICNSVMDVESHNKGLRFTFPRLPRYLSNHCCHPCHYHHSLLLILFIPRQLFATLVVYSSLPGAFIKRSAVYSTNTRTHRRVGLPLPPDSENSELIDSSSMTHAKILLKINK